MGQGDVLVEDAAGSKISETAHYLCIHTLIEAAKSRENFSKIVAD